MDKPQIICHAEKPTSLALYDCRWIPCSAKFVVLGSKPKGTGVISVYEISEGDVKLVKEVEKSKAFKCGTYGASSLQDRYLATGDFEGKLNIWNLEDPVAPVYSANAHKEIINSIDGVGGHSIGCGAPEIVTGSRDGSVKVWDPRQKGKPVATMEPAEGDARRDCWTVAFGNSYNSEERIVCSGYDNGDIKMFDLKTMSLRWETNVKNGVCGIEFDKKDIAMNKMVATTLEAKFYVFDVRTQHPKKGFAHLTYPVVCGIEFDRKDIAMNKMVATTLEAKFYVFDVRTQHPKKGFAHLTEKAHKSTIWLVQHLPQNRDIFATCGGSGSLCLWKYNYPSSRVTSDTDGNEMGIIGTTSLLQNTTLCTQPVSSLDWSPDKQGIAVCTSFDQTIRVIIVTKLNTL